MPPITIGSNVDRRRQDDAELARKRYMNRRAWALRRPLPYPEVGL